MEGAISFIFYIIILLFSVIIHEVAHGAVAYGLGDPTAKYAGRLTLNPIPHIDIFGSILLPLMLFMFGSPVLLGWAKPVPYNPYNLRSPFPWLRAGKNSGQALVGLAGPAANIFLALVMSVILRVLPLFSGLTPEFIANFSAPLSIIILLNIGLAIFNLIPIPPLDGSKLLFSFLPSQWMYIQHFLEQNGLFVLLFFIFFFSSALTPIIFFFFRLLTGGASF